MAIKRKYSIYEASDILYQVSELHLTNIHRDYGTGEKFTSVEVHTLAYIVDNPGISVTQLAHDLRKTKGAVSQMVKKLVEKGLLRRLDSSSNDRTTLLFPTEAGLELHNAHKQFDTAAAFGRSYKALCEVFTPEEVNNAWHILETWLRIRRQMGWH